MLKKISAITLTVNMISFPALSEAGQSPRFKSMSAVPLPPSVTQLPVLKNVVSGVLTPLTDAARNAMTVTQTQDKAVVDWQSFDVGSKATVSFTGQQNWTVLNRIDDVKPSAIFGKVLADQRVILVNRNGIYFDKGSQFNSQSLTASSLSLWKADFDKGLLKFRSTDESGTAYTPGPVFNAGTMGPALVRNADGSIVTNPDGSAKILPGNSVYLVGGSVENSGTITAPVGQIGLAAGDTVEIRPDDRGPNAVAVTMPAAPTLSYDVINHPGGVMTAETGLVGMYGGTVTQNGIIRAVTAVKKNGQIELKASNRIITGAGSETSTPVSDDPETVNETFPEQKGIITLGGLDPSKPVVVDGVQTGRIELNGVMRSQSGNVYLSATDRVFMGAGSLLDVSGVNQQQAKPAEANLLEAKLTSQKLSDDFLQKNGLLFNASIKFDAHLGSTIGNVSDYLLQRDVTAQDRSVSGGMVRVTSKSGDIVMKKGAQILMGGGKTHYNAGSYAITTLVSGGKSYFIHEAPTNLTYDRIGERRLYRPEHDEGGDAGTLTLLGRKIYLDGAIDSSVTRGLYQTKTAEPTDAIGRQYARGLREPKGGTLEIGDVIVADRLNSSVRSLDLVTGDITIKGGALNESADIAADSDVQLAGPSRISADLLSGAGLNTLFVSGNGTLSIEKGARIAVQPTGTINAVAERIVHDGELVAAGGTIKLQTIDSVKPLDAPVTQRIFLGEHSVTSVAGERLDESLPSGVWRGFARTAGGSVEIKDRAREGGLGVEVTDGALIDVSGGYYAGSNRKVTGGDAGTLQIQGETMILHGEMRGDALLGKKGGSILLHGGDVTVSQERDAMPASFGKDTAVPDALKGKLNLWTGALDRSGFSRIELRSAGDLTVADGAVLAPSLARQVVPPAGRAFRRQLQDAPPELAGQTWVRGTAGMQLDRNAEGLNDNTAATLSIRPGATVNVAPGGEVTLTGQQVNIAGSIVAPASTVGIEAKNGDLTVKSGAKITASAYNLNDIAPVASYVPLGITPLNGGTISLKTPGTLTLEGGSAIDVSGSAPATAYLKRADGRISQAVVAGAPGAVSFDSGMLADNSRLTAFSYLPGMPGGSFSLTSRNPAGISLDQTLFSRLTTNGFDSLSFSVPGTMTLAGPIAATAGRSIALNTPELLVTDNASLAAPWIRLLNGSSQVETTGRSPVAGNGSLSLKGSWIDLEGDVAISGAGKVELSSQETIRATDRKYNNNTIPGIWLGRLATPGALSLVSSVVYPTSLSNFTFSAGGDISVAPSGSQAPLLASAGGRLAFETPGSITVSGSIAAPMGTVDLKTTGQDKRIYVEKGARISVTGQALAKYGSSDEVSWTITDRASATDRDVTAEPAKGITLSAGKGEVIVRGGATVDASGGGGIFSYQFQPGITGTNDPLKKKGRYVIMPDNSVRIPGDAVYLSGGNGLAPGVYSLLPEEYAFLPGALVVTDLGITVAPNEARTTREGYAVAAGYRTTQGSGTTASLWKGFEIRRAADVLKEGSFNPHTLVAGNGGDMTVSGATTIIEGTLAAAALPGGTGSQGGVVNLSGRNMTILKTPLPLPAGFGVTTPLEDRFKGTFQIADSSISDKGFREVRLGSYNAAAPTDPGTTSTVTIETGSTVNAGAITVGAADAITLKDGATVNATGTGAQSGTVSLVTGGTLSIGQNGAVSGVNGVVLDTTALDLKGTVQSSKGEVALKSDRIIYTSDADTDRSTRALYVTDSLWRTLSANPVMRLASRSDMLFRSNFALDNGGRFTLEASRIGSVNGATVTVGSDTNRLKSFTMNGVGSNPGSAPQSGNGVFTASADAIAVGPGSQVLDGFASVNIRAKNDLTFTGVGTLATAGDMDLQGGRITGAGYRTSQDVYQKGDYAVSASGALTTEGTTGTAGTSAVPGGKLAFEARSITHSGAIDLPSGTISMKATGTGADDGIYLKAGSSIAAKGKNFATAASDVSIPFDGGSVELNAGAGTFRQEAGAVIDVSAEAGGDAGRIAVAAVNKAAEISGTLSGTAGAGSRGGSFSLDTQSVADLSTLAGKLANGGFTDSVAVRARTGDLTLDGGKTLKGSDVRLAADAGAITVNGTVDASGAAGGVVDLAAANAVVVGTTGQILAKAGGTGTGNGGDVSLRSVNGAVQVAGTIDAGGSTGGRGGTVTLDAGRTATGGSAADNDVMVVLSGSVTGADRLDVVATRTDRQAQQTLAVDGTMIAAKDAENQAFVANAASAAARLRDAFVAGGGKAEAFHFRPGVQIENDGAINVAGPVALTGFRYGGEAGVLGLRATGNLTVSQDIMDNPTAVPALHSSTAAESWRIGLVAGADRNAADRMATVRNVGDITVADKKRVYTERGGIDFAAGNNVTINQGGTGTMIDSTTPFVIGSYAGPIRGAVGNDLKMAGAIQTATGNIRINVGNDLYTQTDSLHKLGAIRTLGEHADFANKMGNFWEYGNGGSIALRVGRNINNPADTSSNVIITNAWDKAYAPCSGPSCRSLPKVWGASYQTDTRANTLTTSGLATLGGGSLDIRTGGAFIGQAGTFGAGNLRLTTGGDMKGRFLVRQGEGKLRSTANLGSKSDRPVFEMFDADLRVTATGDTLVGGVVNPGLARPGMEIGSGNNLRLRNLYGQSAAVRLASLGGDVALSTRSFYTATSANPNGSKVLPSTLEAYAGRAIRLETESLTLSPYKSGNLRLAAAGDVSGVVSSGIPDNVLQTTFIKMLETDPDLSTMYGEASRFDPNSLSLRTREASLLHKNDSQPVKIAAAGNVTNLELLIPKSAAITAGADVRNLILAGENLNEGDTTLVKAGGNIELATRKIKTIVVDSNNKKSMRKNQQNTGIKIDGPGSFVMQAGGSIDLGDSEGIDTNGNGLNYLLPKKGSTIVLAAGVGQQLSGDGTTALMGSIKKIGEEYSNLKATGNGAGADAVLAKARQNSIDPLFSGRPSGSISMVSSEVSSKGGSDVYLIASGDVNVGKSAFVDKDMDKSSIPPTGVTTAAGGDIGVLARGNINVNESRIMTFFGGNITVWSDHGDINAGRGSRTAISAEAPKTVFNASTNQYEYKFTAPAVGSGIRTLTYDPDGVMGPLQAPETGDIALVAPNGTIDAGEAGIVGRRVTLGAREVLNRQAIGALLSVVGAPKASGAVSLGSMSGSNSLAQSTRMVEKVSSLGGEGDRSTNNEAKKVDKFLSSWIDVKFISFDQEQQEGEGR